MDSCLTISIKRRNCATRLNALSAVSCEDCKNYYKTIASMNIKPPIDWYLILVFQVVVAYCLSILVLSFLYVIIENGWWIFPKNHKYSINFENNLTYSNDDLSMVISKNGLESPNHYRP